MTDYPPNKKQQDSSPHSRSSESTRVPPTVYAQLEALRKSGVVNMHSEVHAGLGAFGFEEARRWLETNPELYCQGLTKGFKPTDPDAVETIDPEALADAVPDKQSTFTRGDASTPNEQYLLDHLASLRRFSAEADTYYVDGSWRKTAVLTNAERELAEQFDVAADCEPRRCYRNALTTAAIFGDTHDLGYVEGYVMTSSFASPIAHAWVELNGKVVELTFPEGPTPPSDAAYLGVEFTLDDVKAKIFDEGIAEPLVD